MRRFAVLLASLAFAATAHAQQPKLTWIRYFQVQPGKDADFLRLFRDSSQAALDKMIAEKKAVGWGVVVPFSHTNEPWTHAVYVGLSDWSAVDALVSAEDATEAALSPADRSILHNLELTTLVPNTMRDTVITHVVQSTATPAKKSKYIVVNLHPIKAGREGDAVTLFNEWAPPIFHDLETKGKVGPWGLSVQNIVMNDDSWTHMVWYFVPDLETLDEVNAAWIALGPKLRGYFIRMNDMSSAQYRGQILKIVYSSP
jgi:hypothetical protein